MALVIMPARTLLHNAENYLDEHLEGGGKRQKLVERPIERSNQNEIEMNKVIGRP